MRVCEEFSRHAVAYGQSNIIQAKVAQKLIDDTIDAPKRLLDLGCGDGAIFSRITWECDSFIGVDFSQEMLERHPKSSLCTLMLEDFNNPLLFEKLSNETFDRIYSASALQWATDLEATIKALSCLNTPLSLAIFTSGTFATLMRCANLPSLLKSTQQIMVLGDRYLAANYEILRYSLEFDSVREMFRYIKRSGVSGGRRALGVAQMKQLMASYPLNYLEFEILIISTN